MAKHEQARPTRGRPPASPLNRADQLRQAKRAQRERDRKAGLANLQLKLPAETATRLALASRQPGFAQVLETLLAEETVRIADYPALVDIAWNRAEPYIAAREALSLYERNWRFVEAARLQPHERALIERLSNRFGGGPLDG